MSPRTLRTGRDLSDAGLVGPDQAGAVDAVGRRFSVALPAHLAGLIDRGDPRDPVARQFVPSPDELAFDGEGVGDPTGDGAHSPVRGLVHRYPDRVLLMPTLSCPAYCRYCFRRDRVGRAAGAPGARDIEAALAYVAAREGIREVILSGGDPLSLSDARLAGLLERLGAIGHVEAVRVHTRAPVTVPSRVTPGLLGALTSSGRPWIVLHCNHRRELSAQAAAACRRLAGAGLPLVSQSVLLRGVNDDVDSLAGLLRALVALGVKPYYLHHPDRAAGTRRFRLPLGEGLALVRSLRGRVSGLCQPTYVVEIPGGHGKVQVSEAADNGDGTWTLTDFTGREHLYREEGPPR